MYTLIHAVCTPSHCSPRYKNFTERVMKFFEISREMANGDAN